MGYHGYGWRPYVPVAKRRRQAAAKIAKLAKSGRVVRPVEIEGRAIARTFWGEAWCENLEAYSDYENRLPRGRTYVRNGSVIDLQIEAGRVRALVNGTSIYDVKISIAPLSATRWGAIKNACAGKIDSVVELLRGSISKGVMEVVTREGEGLFPSPREISLSCSCPDWAEMCKHVAAALYGVGARLDHEPEMLFTLRGVEPAEMIAAAAEVPAGRGRARGRVLRADDVSSVFGIELSDEEASAEEETAAAPARRRGKASGKRPTKTPAAKSRAKKVARASTGRKPKARAPSGDTADEAADETVAAKRTKVEAKASPKAKAKPKTRRKATATATAKLESKTTAKAKAKRAASTGARKKTATKKRGGARRRPG